VLIGSKLADQYPVKFVAGKTEYQIVIAGREILAAVGRRARDHHRQPGALEWWCRGELARIFSATVATGGTLSYAISVRSFSRDSSKIGGVTYALALGEVRPVIDAGGIFAPRRKRVLIKGDM